MADRASDEQVAEWREDAVYFGETPRATVELILDELIAERARRDAYPQLSVEWRRDAPCGYPHVDIRHNGMRAVGWVVPDGLEDRLPSFFDGLTWSNPLLPPVLALRVLTVRYDLLERLLTKAAAVLQGELDGFYKGDELYVE